MGEGRLIPVLSRRAAEPLTDAITALHDPNITGANVDDDIWQPMVCPAVVGGVPVCFDGAHLPATYARTLAPHLRPYLR